MNESLAGRFPGFSGNPPAATPASLRLTAKAARLARGGASATLYRNSLPPADLGYVPQANKPSSVFFWSEQATEHDKMLMGRGDYPPQLPRFKHEENQQISKCHPSVWMASAHHLQMMHEGYDRIAFLGDAVAGKCISDLLINDYYCIAGVMGLLKSRLVSNAQFAYFSRIYSIPCKSNEEAQGDAFEALVGGLYLDGKRDGVDVDKIIYDWMKALVEPWVELYINQLPLAQRERVVSLQRAVPIGIAVATSDRSDSHQVMMAWESNIATHLIENRGKLGSAVERGLLEAALKQQQQIEAPTVNVSCTSSVIEADSKVVEEVVEEDEKEQMDREREREERESEEREREEMERTQRDRERERRLKEEKEFEATLDEAALKAKKELQQKRLLEAERAAAERRVQEEEQRLKEEEDERILKEGRRRAEENARRHREEAKRKAEEERRKAEEERRKAEEERRVREEEHRKAEEALAAARELEKSRRLEEEARRLKFIQRQELARREERMKREYEEAKAEAEQIKARAEEEAKKKFEQNRSKTKAEKRAMKRALQLEHEMRRAEAARMKADEVLGIKPAPPEAEVETAEEAEEAEETAEPETTPDATTTPDAKTTPPPSPPPQTAAEPTPTETRTVVETPATKEDFISTKQAADALALASRETALKNSRVLYDIERMEERCTRRMNEMLAQNPYISEEQKSAFKQGWNDVMRKEREKIARDGGVDLKIIEDEMRRKEESEPEERQEEKKVEEEKEEEEEKKGFFGKLWGAFTGKK